MAKVIEFPDIKGEQAAYDEKMQLIAFCHDQLTTVFAVMRERGADDKQILRILRHAVAELEQGEAS